MRGLARAVYSTLNAPSLCYNRRNTHPTHPGGPPHRKREKHRTVRTQWVHVWADGDSQKDGTTYLVPPKNGDYLVTHIYLIRHAQQFSAHNDQGLLLSDHEDGLTE